MAQLEYKEPVLVKKGVRVRLNELHVGAESGWRDENKKMIEQYEQVFQDQYLTSKMGDPSLLAVQAEWKVDSDSNLKCAADGIIRFLDGRSTISALNLLRNI